MSYSDYTKERTTAIKDCLSELGCQPIIFAGAGISRRYINGPSWYDLLDGISKKNPYAKNSIAYLYQKHKNLLDVGEHLIDNFHEWAWAEGKNEFPEELFLPETPPSDFLKYFVAKYVENLTPKDASKASTSQTKKEIEQLKSIRPHSIITTNYDTLCESIFPEYTPVIGQKIIRASGISIGEIFKIHGCVSDYREIVVTRSDYNDWTNKKKYLSAKLLTYFLEHPVIIIGYGAQDPNVLAILRDIDEILACPGSLVPNIFYLIHEDGIEKRPGQPPRDILLELGNGNSMRVNAIYASDFNWAYKAFEASSTLENINPRMLRALMARTYDLVRHDIPRMGVQVDFTTLEQAASSNGSLPKLLGITGLNDPDMFNANYPHTLTGVGKRLGFTSWHKPNQLIQIIKNEKGIDIKASDNQYHVKVKSGDKSQIDKYSEALVDVLQKMIKGEDYDIQLKKKTKK